MKRKRSTKRFSKQKRHRLGAAAPASKMGNFPSSYWRRVKEAREETHRRSGFKRVKTSFVQGGAPGLKR